jgi:hypothetical protein
MESEPRKSGDIVQRAAQVLAALAGLASLVYLAGGLVLAVRLEQLSLPWEPVIGQLPREFLLSIGIGQVVFPACLAAAAYAVSRLMYRTKEKPPFRRLRADKPDSANTRRWCAHAALLLAAMCLVTWAGWALTHTQDPGVARPASPGLLSVHWLVVALALLISAVTATELRGKVAEDAADWHSFDTAALMTGIYGAAFIPAFIAVFAGAPLNRAIVCRTAGGSRSGVLIGQTSDRVYLGEDRRAGARARIMAFPASKVDEVYIGSAPSRLTDCAHAS